MRDRKPQPGDILIRRQIHSPKVYNLGIVDREPQITCRSYGEALRHATGFAQATGIDAWFTTDDSTFKRVARHRPE